MKLEKLISILGKPGLFHLISQTKSGFVVQELSSQKKVVISSTHQVNLLSNIAVYIGDVEMPLFLVFEKLAQDYNYEHLGTHKLASKDLVAFLEKSFPHYDKERVYGSDIKKIMQWYNILQEKNLLTPEFFEQYRKDNPLEQEQEG